MESSGRRGIKVAAKDEREATYKVALEYTPRHPFVCRPAAGERLFEVCLTAKEIQSPLSDQKPICAICDGHGMVNAPWPSGYPHAIPCPACRPNEACRCGSPICPGPACVAEWKAKKGG
jgi:hypothetical protein